MLLIFFQRINIRVSELPGGASGRETDGGVIVLGASANHVFLSGGSEPRFHSTRLCGVAGSCRGYHGI